MTIGKLEKIGLICAFICQRDKVLHGGKKKKKHNGKGVRCPGCHNAEESLFLPTEELERTAIVDRL